MNRFFETFLLFLLIRGSTVSEQRIHEAVPTPCDHNNGGCSSTCLISTNERGYSCACPTGIPLLSDQRTCAHEGQSFLLVANTKNILKISLDDSNYAAEELQIDGIKFARDIDFDPLDGHVYWLDGKSMVIRRAYLNGSGWKDIVSTDLSTPKGIAIDYVARKLYWTDWKKHCIETSDLNGNNRKVVLRKGINLPLSIVVDPEAERIYWTDSLARRIESSSLNGTDRYVVIDTNVGWLSSLALDYERKVIYWADSNTKKIEMANVDGSDRSVLISNGIQRIYGSSLLGDYIYWTDGEKHVIERANKITGDKRQVIVDNLSDLRTLKAFIIRNIRERTCDPLLPPINGSIIGQNKQSVNSVASFVCSSGYRLVGNDNTTCLWLDGKLQWSNPIPECIEIIQCKKLSFYSYNITYDRKQEEYLWTDMEYLSGTRATVTCDAGFEIFPLRPIITNTATTVCVNGQWKPDILNCTAARCSCTKLPQEMIERKRKLAYCDQFVPSGTYDQRTECEEGYKAEGNYGAICGWGIWYIHTPVTQYNRCIRIKDCPLDLKGKDDLTAYHRDHIFEAEEIDFVHRSTVKFACKSFYSTLEGAKNATCIDGQWSNEIPKCKQTSSTDSLHPPFLWVYFANFNRINADDGRVMIPKETPFRIICWSPETRQLNLNEQNSAGKQFLRVNFSSEDMFSSVKVIDPVREKMEATVECINSKGISTEFNIVIADTCEVNENELNRRGLQVVPDSRQRIYIEGDRIQVECSSNARRTDRFIMICKSGREWEYAMNMDC